MSYSAFAFMDRPSKASISCGKAKSTCLLWVPVEVCRVVCHVTPFSESWHQNIGSTGDQSETWNLDEQFATVFTACRIHKIAPQN